MSRTWPDTSSPCRCSWTAVLDIVWTCFQCSRERAEPTTPLVKRRNIRTATPFVLRSGDGSFLPENAEGIDIAVVHPRTCYVNGRPIWLSTGGWRRPVPIAQLAAYHAAIPALQKGGHNSAPGFSRYR